MAGYLIHGTWIPQKSEGGCFYSWVETDEMRDNGKAGHPFHLAGDTLHSFFRTEIGLTLPEQGKRCYFIFPSTAKEPLLSYALNMYGGHDIPGEYSWRWWGVDCLEIREPLAFLKDIHFLSTYFPGNIRLGEDLVFWYGFSGILRDVIIKDQYIPALRCRTKNGTPQADGKKAAQGSAGTNKPGTEAATYTFFAGWEILSHDFEDRITEYGSLMPAICTAGRETRGSEPVLFEPGSLLRGFSTEVLESLVRKTSFPKNLKHHASGTFVEDCLSETGSRPLPLTSNVPETWKKWHLWKRNLFAPGDASTFFLCFRLKSPDAESSGEWVLEFLAQSRKDPSLKLEMARFWEMAGKMKTREIVYDFINENFNRELLVKLGHAARIYPKLWEGMKSDTPSSLFLSLDDAYAFLKESAFILEDAGYKIIVPSWWTASGKKSVKVRIKTASSQSGTGASRGFFSLESIISYEYDLSIGGHPLSPEEWKLLVNAKKPLVNFRGEWIELDRERMARLLDFWENYKDGKNAMSVGELLIRKSEEDDEFDFSFDSTLSEIMDRLRDKGLYNLIEAIPGFNGTLRDYQKRGTSWLYYLETLGLNPCLADDMGLGKTIEVIALMVYERTVGQITEPSLFIVPTSVIGNWKKEIEGFGPGLSVMIHHGPGRIQDADGFTKVARDHDIIITSFALVRRDEPLLRSLEWHRIVVDEAQNIKNPKAAQTKVIGKLSSSHRIALTGTPIENRLMDLWSLFHFLNPGYLPSAGLFRKKYEIPIQKESDQRKSGILKKLVEPFILRRLKSDRDIINDLPDKVEQKIFCNLTREQASLYQAVVDDVAETIEETEGIERKGLILSTLLRLKQICNHPVQYLRDGSEFTGERSYKLSRLSDMAGEIIENEESLLIFSQFREICSALEEYIIKTHHCNTYLLHGGTTRKKRDAMMEEFQDPSTGPGVFILSLKAGGVGITLTRANHVFHFDRWWNPAVENQATDRAYRIGQEKNVFVHKFVTLGTLEERIDQMLEKKQELSDSIIGSDESWLGDLDNDAFRELIALNREAVL